MVNWNRTSFMSDPREGGREVFAMQRVLPAPSLRPFIEHYFVMRWEVPAGRVVESLVVPSGTAKCFFDRRVPGDLAVVGPLTSFVRPTFRESGSMIGVSFRPWGFARFFRSRMVELVDLQSSEGTAMHGADTRTLAQRVLQLGSMTAARKHLDAYFVSRLAHARPSSSELCVRECLTSLGDRGGKVRLKDLSSEQGCSERRLQRAFRDVVGLAPSFVLRLARMHGVLGSLQGGRSVRLAELATRYGFFDQAHLTNEVRTLTGLTPAALARTLPRVGFFQASTTARR